MNDIVMDQIPELNEMARWLELLNLYDAPKPKSDLIMEQVSNSSSFTKFFALLEYNRKNLAL